MSSKRSAYSLILIASCLTTLATASAAVAKGGGGHGGASAHAGGSGISLFGRGGRGGRGRRGNNNINQGPTDEQLQAAYFHKRSSENPYSHVPQHVNLASYIKTY